MSHPTPPPVTHRETVHKYLTVRQTRQHDLERIAPIGEIDLCTAPILREALADADRRAVPSVLVDLSEVDFLALLGVQLLQNAAEQATASGRRMVIVAPTPLVQRVLSLTDVVGELETYVSMPEALTALELVKETAPVT